jgi:hypothetical protein
VKNFNAGTAVVCVCVCFDITDALRKEDQFRLRPTSLFPSIDSSAKSMFEKHAGTAKKCVQPKRDREKRLLEPVNKLSNNCKYCRFGILQKYGDSVPARP